MGYLYYETYTMEEGLRENMKEEDMESDGRVKDVEMEIWGWDKE